MFVKKHSKSVPRGTPKIKPEGGTPKHTAAKRRKKREMSQVHMPTEERGGVAPGRHTSCPREEWTGQARTPFSTTEDLQTEEAFTLTVLSQASKDKHAKRGTQNQRRVGDPPK